MPDFGNKIDQSSVPSDVVSTPEGDNEFAPEEPLAPTEGMQIPAGNAPDPYNEDKPNDTKETVDKLCVGQILA